MPDIAGTPLSSSYSYVVVGIVSSSYNAASTTYSGYFILDNTNVQLDIPAIVDDVTTSAMLLGTQKMAQKHDPKVTITFPEDDPSSLEAASLTQGARYTLYLRRGNSTLSNKQWDIVETMTFTGRSKSAETATGTKRTIVANFEGGVYTGYTTCGSGVASYIAGVSPART